MSPSTTRPQFRQRYFFPAKNSAGFTLLEILLVACLFAAVVGLTAPLAWKFVMKNDLDTAAETIAKSLRRAQALSALGASDSSWGAYLESQKVTLFAGESFEARNSSQDERLDLPTAIAITGPQQIIFKKISGRPESEAVITLSNQSGQGRTITVNPAGTIGY